MPAAFADDGRSFAEMSAMIASRPTRDVLFEGGPSIELPRRFGLLRGSRRDVVFRAAFVIALAWLPLVILSTAQALALNTDSELSILRDVGAHARYLLAAPLLIVAEAECGGRLSIVLRQFITAGLVPDGQVERFNTAIASSRRLFDSKAAYAAIAALAYLIGVTALVSLPAEQVPAWMRPVSVIPLYSLAGWWHLLVSIPLLLIAVLGWIWRLALWTRILWLTTRLDLHLMASHPDRAAGLGFLAISVRGFSIVSAAFAIITAGRAGNVVLLAGALPPRQFVIYAGAQLAFATLFVAPLLAFTPALLKTWRKGTLEYGSLSRRVGSAFEDKWFVANRGAEPAALDKPDFSATTDLYSITANVQAIRFVPIDNASLLMLAGATLLPFVPVAVLTVPLDVIWSNIKDLLI